MVSIDSGRGGISFIRDSIISGAVLRPPVFENTPPMIVNLQVQAAGTLKPKP